MRGFKAPRFTTKGPVVGTDTKNEQPTTTEAVPAQHPPSTISIAPPLPPGAPYRPPRPVETASAPSNGPSSSAALPVEGHVITGRPKPGGFKVPRPLEKSAHNNSTNPSAPTPDPRTVSGDEAGPSLPLPPPLPRPAPALPSARGGFQTAAKLLTAATTVATAPPGRTRRPALPAPTDPEDTWPAAAAAALETIDPVAVAAAAAAAAARDAKRAKRREKLAREKDDRLRHPQQSIDAMFRRYNERQSLPSDDLVDALSPEIWLNVLRRLPPAQLLSTMPRVCRLFRALVTAAPQLQFTRHAAALQRYGNERRVQLQRRRSAAAAAAAASQGGFAIDSLGRTVTRSQGGDPDPEGLGGEGAEDTTQSLQSLQLPPDVAAAVAALTEELEVRTLAHVVEVLAREAPWADGGPEVGELAVRLGAAGRARASDHAATLRRLALLTPSLHAGLPLPSPSAPPPALYRWDETFLALSELPVVQAPGRGASGWATLALFLLFGIGPDSECLADALHCALHTGPSSALLREFVHFLLTFLDASAFGLLSDSPEQAPPLQPRGLTAAPRALPYARLSAALRLALAILEARREAETAGAGAHASVQVQAHAHAGAVQWTAEQRAVIGTDLKKGEVLIVSALAGSGKTSTLLRYMAERPAQRFLLLAFNRHNRDVGRDRTSTAQNVTSHTFHSLAQQKVGWRLGGDGRRFSGRLRRREVAGFLGRSEFDPAVQLVVTALEAFFKSVDPHPSAAHLPPEASRLDRDPAFLEDLIFYCTAVWSQMTDPGCPAAAAAAPDARSLHLNLEQAIGVNDDAVLKFAQLHPPALHLAYDCIMVDEAQDITPAMADLVLSQRGLAAVFVGDPHQQIYGWAGAVNAMQAARDRLQRPQPHANMCMPGDVAPSGAALPPLSVLHERTLSRSFRFGPGIAAIANAILAVKGAGGAGGRVARVIGNPVRGRCPGSVLVVDPRAFLADICQAYRAGHLRPVAGDDHPPPPRLAELRASLPLCVLSRTNASALALLAQAAEAGVPFHCTGGLENESGSGALGLQVYEDLLHLYVFSCGTAAAAGSDEDGYGSGDVTSGSLVRAARDAHAYLLTRRALLTAPGPRVKGANPAAGIGPMLAAVLRRVPGDRGVAAEENLFLSALEGARATGDQELLTRCITVQRVMESDRGCFRGCALPALASLAAIRRRHCAAPTDALLIFSTAHRAKGLEFPAVLVWNDRFARLQSARHSPGGDRLECEAADAFGSGRTYAPMDPDELHAVYVAVTRAKHQLFLSPDLHALICSGTPNLPTNLGPAPKVVALQPGPAAAAAAAARKRHFFPDPPSHPVLYIVEAAGDAVAAPLVVPAQTGGWFGRHADDLLRAAGLAVPGTGEEAEDWSPGEALQPLICARSFARLALPEGPGPAAQYPCDDSNSGGGSGAALQLSLEEMEAEDRSLQLERGGRSAMSAEAIAGAWVGFLRENRDLFA